MKQYMLFVWAILALILAGCESETVPCGTAVEKMTGDWWITVDVIEGDEIHEDGLGVGHILMYTYNTAANLPTEMWLDDASHFWEYKLKVRVDYANRTFYTPDFEANQTYESKVKVTDGKVVKEGTKSPSGQPADYIEYKIQFDDDPGEGIYFVKGFRRTGFPADDF
jgi:hypothetical protein